MEKFPTLSENATRILVALSGRQLHGYGIMKQVQKDTDVRIPIGSLYRTIAKLIKDGLIEETPAPKNIDSEDERRKYYRTTAIGERAYREQIIRYQTIINAASALSILNSGGNYA